MFTIFCIVKLSIYFLLNRGADIEAQDVDSYTPLLTAVAYGQKDAMETLLAAGCCCDALDRDGKSMIFIAAEENEYEVLKVSVLYVFTLHSGLLFNCLCMYSLYTKVFYLPI